MPWPFQVGSAVGLQILPHIWSLLSHQFFACRDLLAAPVGRTLFFAGEATHPAINPCLQAAMDTGLRAASEVQQAAKNVSRM